MLISWLFKPERINKSYNGAEPRNYFYFSESLTFCPIICKGLFWVKKNHYFNFNLIPNFFYVFDSPSCRMNKLQMTLETRMFTLDKSNIQLRLRLDSRVIFYPLKYGWNVFLKARKWFFLYCGVTRANYTAAWFISRSMFTDISLCAMPTLNKGFLIICFRVVCLGLEGFACASLI